MNSTIRTDRLLLDEVRDEDVHAIFRLRTDVLVNAHIDRPTPSNMVDAQRWLDKVRSDVAEGLSHFWAIRLHAQPELIGTICIWNISGRHGELGYDLFPAFHQRGIMGEAVKAVIEYGRDKLLLQFLDAYTQQGNIPSRHLLQSAGFHLEPDIKDKHNAQNVVYRRRF